MTARALATGSEPLALDPVKVRPARERVGTQGGAIFHSEGWEGTEYVCHMCECTAQTYNVL